MGFRIIEMFVLLLLIAAIVWFIGNVIHFVVKSDSDGEGFFNLSKSWQEQAKKKAKK